MFLEISTRNLVIYFSYAVFFGTIWLGVVVHRKKTQRDIKLIVDSNSPFNALKELMYKAGEAIVRMITYSVIGMIVTIFLFDLVPVLSILTNLFPENTPQFSEVSTKFLYSA